MGQLSHVKLVSSLLLAAYAAWLFWPAAHPAPTPAATHGAAAATTASEAAAAVTATATTGRRRSSHIPRFGLGTWRSERGAVGAAVAEALDLGYRHIDMAPRYRNQKEIGEALQGRLCKEEGAGAGAGRRGRGRTPPPSPPPSPPGCVPRASLFLASKLWNTDHGRVAEAVAETLAELQVEYLDMLYMHWPVALVAGHDSPGDIAFDDAAPTLEETWAAMEEEVVKGRVRRLGVSNFNTKQLDRLLQTAVVVPSANQIELHPYLPQGRLVRYCRRRGIDVVAYCPIGSPGNAARNRADVPAVIRHPTVTAIAAEHGVTAAQAVLKWAMQHGVAVIPKSVTPSRIRENLAAHETVDAAPLSAAALAALDSVAQQAGGPVRYCAAEHYMRPGVTQAEFWDDDGGETLGRAEGRERRL